MSDLLEKYVEELIKVCEEAGCETKLTKIVKDLLGTNGCWAEKRECPYGSYNDKFKKASLDLCVECSNSPFELESAEDLLEYLVKNESDAVKDMTEIVSNKLKLSEIIILRIK